jgi:hypothetical protein
VRCQLLLQAAAADKGDASKAAASKAEVDALLALKKELEAAEAAALYQVRGRGWGRGGWGR